MHSLGASNPLSEHSPDTESKQQDDSPGEAKADWGEIGLDGTNQRMQQLKHIHFSIATDVLIKLIELMRICNLARERTPKNSSKGTGFAVPLPMKTERQICVSPVNACNAPQSCSIRKEYHLNLSEARDLRREREGRRARRRNHPTRTSTLLTGLLLTAPRHSSILAGLTRVGCLSPPVQKQEAQNWHRFPVCTSGTPSVLPASP